MERVEVTYLDTHVILWLHDRQHKRLSQPARRKIARGDVLISPAAVLELQFLYEIGRLRSGAAEIIARLSSDLEIRVCEFPFPAITECALGLSWARDPFDRLIVGHAFARNSVLITKDEDIRAHYSRAVW